MNKKNKNWKLKQLLLDLLFFLVLLALDQGTKYLAVTHLKDRSSVKIWPGVFELQYLENRGAAFGILQDGKLFFVFAAIVMLTVIAFILVKTPKGKKYRTWHILLTFIAAGAIGNMIDRLRLDYVVDFFYFKWIDFLNMTIYEQRCKATDYTAIYCQSTLSEIENTQQIVFVLIP